MHVKISADNPERREKTPEEKAAYLRSNLHAIHDLDLPAIVRGFLAIGQGNATETLAIKEAGFMPHLYATYEGARCEIYYVSDMGDVKIRYLDGTRDTRCSVYDLTDFALTPDPMAEPPNGQIVYLMKDKRGVPLKPAGDSLVQSDNHLHLFTEGKSPYRLNNKHDRFGFKGITIGQYRLIKT